MESTASSPRNGHFFWVDAIRGIAALCVVVFHYHHFYLADAFDRSSLPSISTFPYASLITPLYMHGHFAVELFWIISGFVFAYVYINRKVSARVFIAARVARLFPLHLAILFFVAGLQFVSIESVGHWQIYANNDVRHFLLNLTMASQWSTWSRGLSFNGPIWSVSLEVGAYAMFFITLGLLRSVGVILAILLAISCFLIGSSDLSLKLVRLSLFNCASYFFVGTIAYYLYVSIGGRIYLSLVSIMGFMLIGLFCYFYGYEQLAIMSFSSSLLLFAAQLDCIGTVGKNLVSLLKSLGDLSYSIYLVHVPLQMVFLLWLDISLEQSREFAQSYLTLPIYLITVVLISWVVHVYFERPAGRYLRSRL